MANEPVKSPAEIAEETRQTAHEANEALHGHAVEAQQVGQAAMRSMQSSAEDAKQTGAEALDTARGVAADLRDRASDAAQIGKVYARNAVNAAGRKLSTWQDQMADAQASCTRYIAQEPVKATLLAVAGGALLTGLLMASLRGPRRGRGRS